MILWHQSGINSKLEPFVQLLFGDKVICQMGPAEARDHAKNILEAIEASEQDAFLVHFFMTELKFQKQEAIQTLLLFRQYREAQGKKGPPSDVSEFVVTDEHKKPGA
jgi:hypothetical protein